MIDRLINRLVFLLERFLLRGAFYQLLFIAALIVLVSIISGMVVHFFLPAEFKDYGESVWWGLLRLSDPGYLGDDKGALQRIVSLIVTVLGYVLFMGSLVAIMTTALSRLMRRLEMGLTPISHKGHLLILGWNNRTETIIKELLLSEGRVRRFLARVRAGRLHIVVLAEDITTTLVHDLKSRLGPLYDERKITFRSGNSLRVEHLARADFLNASAIILSADDFAGIEQEALDARTIKTLLSISNAARNIGDDSPPPLTCEIFDTRRTPIAQAGYQGEIEIIPSAAVISRLIVQNVRHSGLSYVYSELLTHASGNQIYIRDSAALAGELFEDIATVFPRAVPLGVMRVQSGGLVPMLNPQHGLRVTKDDKIIFIAQDYENSEPAGTPSRLTYRDAAEIPVDTDTSAKKILCLGWSHKLPALLSEFASYGSESFVIDVVSMTSATEREALIDRFAVPLDNLNVQHIEADYTAPNDLSRILSQTYDNILFLASDRMSSGEESDARTILGYLLLGRELPAGAPRPSVLIELMDSENKHLFDERSGEVLISPEILSHMLTSVTLRPGLRIIFEELFTSDGAEIFFRPPEYYVELGQELRFCDLQKAIAARGDIALGIFRAATPDLESVDRLSLNPVRDSLWTLAPGDELVVLTTYVRRNSNRREGREEVSDEESRTPADSYV